jgi:LemA protein
MALALSIRGMAASGALARLLRPLAVLPLLLLASCGVNNIPTYEEAAKAAWSQVLNQYQRRADLIPNLVETVKGYASHEQQTLTEIVDARSRVAQMQIPPDILTNPDAFKAFQENQSALSGALSRLLVVVERYPDLKANQNFLTLQSQLEGTENRISVARRDFIDAVRVYNTELRTIPGRWWASFLYPEAQPMESFTVAEDVMQAPKVDFGTGGSGG